MSNSVALITGASGGIGRASAHELASRGYSMSLVARNQDRLNAVAAELAGSHAVGADVSDAAAAERAVEAAANRWGRIDALVHCAGLAPMASVEQTGVEQWRAVLDTNLSSAFYLAKAAWPIFRRQGGGVIVNLSSFACRDPFPGFAAYGAAKAGLNILDLVLAREGKEIGVRVHTIAPGAVETAMFRSLVTAEQWPAARTLTPEEVARVVAQCVCGDLRYTSGEVIFVSKTL